MPVEKRATRWCKGIVVARFRQKSLDDEVVTQNAQAAFCGIGGGCQGRRAAAVADQGENIEFYGGLDCSRFPTCKHRIHDQIGRNLVHACFRCRR